jgi:hypothetical protein
MGTTSEILEELKQWQSPLAEAPRSMPYDMPDNYFNGFCDSIITAIHEAEEQKPQFGNDKTPFATPENYFSTLPQDILAKAKQSDATTTGKQTIAFRSIVRAVAAVLVIAIGIIGYRYFTQEPTAQQQLASISNEDISNYLEQHSDEFDTELLATHLSSAELGELENIANDDIIEYLDETGWNVDASIN